MSPFFTAGCILALTISLKAQNTSTAALNIGEIQTLHSRVLNEHRTLNICLPATYDSSKSYPVLYLLDGSLHEDFLHLTGLLQFFNLQFRMPEFIVVGIANIDRKRDFTFHTDQRDLQESFPTAGHSAAFIQFIETELQPFIQTQYNCSGPRFLIGQSLGGLLATEILLKKPGLFSHYFIVSPSLWWDGESLLRQAPALLAAQADEERYVYLSVGKQEPRVMRNVARKLHRILKNAGKRQLQIDFLRMKKENHATILHNSIYQGFRRLYPYRAR